VRGHLENPAASGLPVVLAGSPAADAFAHGLASRYRKIRYGQAVAVKPPRKRAVGMDEHVLGLAETVVMRSTAALGTGSASTQVADNATS
jgi:hypothetical protein